MSYPLHEQATGVASMLRGTMSLEITKSKPAFRVSAQPSAARATEVVLLATGAVTEGQPVVALVEP